MQYKLEDACDCGLFRALGEPNRVRLLSELAASGEARTMGEVAECCSVDLSVVSRHLGILREAGVVNSRKEGRRVFFELDRKHLVAALRGMADCLEAGCDC